MTAPSHRNPRSEREIALDEHALVAVTRAEWQKRPFAAGAIANAAVAVVLVLCCVFVAWLIWSGR